MIQLPENGSNGFIMVLITERDVAEAIEHVIEIKNCSIAEALKFQDALVLGVLIELIFGSKVDCANQIIEDMREDGIDGKGLSDDHVVNQVSRHVSGHAKPRRDWITKYCDAMNINADDYKRYKSDVLEFANGIASSKFSEIKSDDRETQTPIGQSRDGREVAVELQKIERNIARIEDNQKKLSSVLGMAQPGVIPEGPKEQFQDVHLNIDDVGRNEALGMIANALVEVAAVPARNRATLVSINKNFRTSKAMLENFLGIESSAVEGVLYDYSKATKKNKNDIDRLISAGIDVSAIRGYGKSAIDAAADAILQSSCAESLTLKISGELHRRRLFIEKLVAYSEKNGLLEWIEIQEVEDSIDLCSPANRRLQLKSELVAGLVANYDGASGENESLSLTDFLVQTVAPDEENGIEPSVRSWIDTSVEEILSEGKYTEKTRSSLRTDEYSAYRLILGFWATKNLHILYKVVSLYCRREGQIPRILAETIDFASQEVSNLGLIDRIQIRRVLRYVRQIRSGVIEARSGSDFFNEVYESLTEKEKLERSLCLYQMSYFHFQMDKLDKAQELVLKALELDSTNVAAICFRAVLEMQKGRSEVASILLNEAQDLDNSYIFIPFYKGVLCEIEGEYEAAIIEYIRSLILAPNFYEAALNLTNCLLDSGRILDAARWVTAFLSKYAAPSFEFQTNIAVGLFQAGYSSHALKMLSSVYAETPAPLIALNIAKVYFGRAQAGPCKDWANKVLASESSTKTELNEARQMADLVGKEESIEMALNAELNVVERSEEVGDALGLLLASEYQIASGTNNDLFQTVRRAIQSKPKKAKKFAPKSVLALRDAEARKANDRKLAKQKRRYSEQIKRGRLDAEPKSSGYRRRKTHRRKSLFPGGIVLTRAPSYSAG